MTNFFSTTPNQYFYNIGILLLRASAGVFMITHGWPKMQNLLAGGEIMFPDPLGVGASTSLILAVFAEVICAFLLVIGLASRLAAIPLIVTMLIAVFVIHQNDGFAKQEMGALYLIIFITLLITGAGKYSVDQLICNRK